MKRTVTFLMAVLMLLVASVSVAATNETIVPQKMEPGTILIYDENCKPTIVQGGYLSTMNATASTMAFNMRLAGVTESASAHEIAQIAMENEAAKEQYDAVMRGETIRMAAPKAYAGMKVVYDEVTGDINNIYFPDANEPTGYSIHNVPREYMAEQTESVQSTARRSGNVSWTWGRHQNTLTYRPGSDSFLGTGRATYFVGTYGNRNNRLVAYDCATQIDFDYSKKVTRPSKLGTWIQMKCLPTIRPTLALCRTQSLIFGEKQIFENWQGQRTMNRRTMRTMSGIITNVSLTSLSRLTN